MNSDVDNGKMITYHHIKTGFSSLRK